MGLGKMRIVKSLVESGENVNVREEFHGGVPLHMAAHEGQTDVVRYLVSQGADIDAKDCDDMTPLHWAARGGKIKTIITLVSLGANMNVRNYCNHTPLDEARQNQFFVLDEENQCYRGLPPGMAPEKFRTVVVEYLESIGAKSGQDINDESTSGKIILFDELTLRGF